MWWKCITHDRRWMHAWIPSPLICDHGGSLTPDGQPGVLRLYLQEVAVYMYSMCNVHRSVCNAVCVLTGCLINEVVWLLCVLVPRCPRPRASGCLTRLNLFGYLLIGLSLVTRGTSWGKSYVYRPRSRIRKKSMLLICVTNCQLDGIWWILRRQRIGIPLFCC